MMKKNTILALTLIGGLTLLAAGCVKEADMNEKYRPEGSPIVFTAATGYENGDGTRTEYSGHFFNGTTELQNTDPLSSYANSWERIDWVNNDPVMIYYKHPNNSSSNAGYTVSSKTANVENSDASIEVASGSTKLTWAGGNGDHIFTAMYPIAGFNAGNIGDVANNVTFNGTVAGGLIPATQNLTKVSGASKYLPHMQYAYMLARKKITGSSTDHTVYLPFRPAFTAFEFRIKRPATLQNGSTASYKVKSFSITSTAPLAGDFSLTIDNQDNKGALWTNTPTVANNANKSNTVSVTFNGNTGIDLSTSEELIFTLFTLPTNIPSLTLTFTYVNGTSKSITLKDTNNQTKSFDPCKKYIITNSKAGFDEWEYFVDPISDITTYGHKTVSAGFEVRSYKRSKANPNYVVAVPWIIQYITVANPSENDWNNMTASGYNNTSMATTVFKIRNTGDSADGFTGDGSVPGDPKEARLSKIEGEHNSSHTEGSGAADATRAKLASADPRGSAVGTSPGPFDLSTHPCYGTTAQINTAGSMNTANCYVVSAPGYYMFPCVYGNAILGGNDNKSAYSPVTSSDPVTGQSFNTLAGVESDLNTDTAKKVFYTPGFYNAINGQITNPWIKTDLVAYRGSGVSFTDAVVVWQDTHVGDEIIPYPTGNNPATNIGLTTVNNKDYIWFYIDKEDIKPGNLMIALRGRVPVSLDSNNYYGVSNASTNILWSWQIWVTEKDLTPGSNDVLNGYSMMPYNLGWVDTEEGSVKKYYNRTLRYRVIQVENGSTLNGADNKKEFNMTQIGDAIETFNSVGGNPYYQWGRKDPFLSALPQNDPIQSRPVSPHSDYASYIYTNGAVIPAQNISDATLDYQHGILFPYIPYSNTGNGSGSTSWVGGPVYPWKLASGWWSMKERKFGPFLSNPEAVHLNNLGVTNGMFWNMDTPSAGLATYRSEGSYQTVLSDAAVLFLTTNISVHFPSSNFMSGAYSATTRSLASCAYNLWNSYLYDEDAPNSDDDNKYKTVYDPCPPGFTVPVKNVFIGNKTVANDFTWISTIEKRTSTNLTVTDTDDDGITFENSFFPFTGARVFYNRNNSPSLEVEHVTDFGLYWTDCAHTIDYATPNAGPYDQTNIGTFSFYHSALILNFGTATKHVQSYTKGSAASIRPMVDPKY